MGLDTGVQWADHTWGPWRGCTKVSAGCARCYMFEEQARYGKNPAEVVRAAPPTFNLPIKEGKNRIKDGEWVFVCSWSDWLHPDADEWRGEAWRMIAHRRGVIFILLTKRLERAIDDPSLFPKDWGAGYPNVILGVSVESGKLAARAEHLAAFPARTKLISAEPILAPLELGDRLRGIDWLILGGESGPSARPVDAGRRDGNDRVRNDVVPVIRGNMELARRHGTRVFVKQLGSVWSYDNGYGANHKGGDPDQWPEALRVRERPDVVLS